MYLKSYLKGPRAGGGEFKELFGKSLNCLVSRTEPVDVDGIKVMMSVKMHR